MIGHIFLLLVLNFFLSGFTFTEHEKSPNFPSGFSFTEHSQVTEQQEKGEVNSNSSLPLPPTTQALRHKSGNSNRQLTFVLTQQPESNWNPLVS